MNTKKTRNRKKRSLRTTITLDIKRLVLSLLTVRRMVPTIVVLVVLACIPLLGYGLYQYLHRSPYFSIKTVMIESGNHLTNSQIIAFLELDKHSNLLKVDPIQLKRRLEYHPWIREAQVEKQLPDTLIIQVKEEKPTAYLLMNSLFLVNSYGELFKLADEDEAFDMPIISGFNKSDFADKVRKEESQRRIREGLAINKLYFSLGLHEKVPLGEINFDQILGFTIVTRTPQTRIRLGFNNYSDKLKKLLVLLEDLGPRYSQVETIFLDNERSTERVTVRFNQATPTIEGNKDG